MSLLSPSVLPPTATMCASPLCASPPPRSGSSLWPPHGLWYIMVFSHLMVFFHPMAIFHLMASTAGLSVAFVAATSASLARPAKANAPPPIAAASGWAGAMMALALPAGRRCCRRSRSRPATACRLPKYMTILGSRGPVVIAPGVPTTTPTVAPGGQHRQLILEDMTHRESIMDSLTRSPSLSLSHRSPSRHDCRFCNLQDLQSPEFAIFRICNIQNLQYSESAIFRMRI